MQNYHARMQDLKPLPPRFVNDGPIFENVLEGDDVDVLKFPVPRHHELDTARFIGTADCVMTQDPDTGWFNLGAYRTPGLRRQDGRLPDHRGQARPHPSRQDISSAASR